MNKDLYIALLEEHVDDLSTAMKIDTVLSLRKTEKIKGLKSELASASDWNKAQDELISKIADTAMDYQAELNELSNLTLDLAKDINDLQADWADDRIDCIEESDKIQINYVGQVDELRCDFMKTLETIKEQNTRECDLNVRLQGKIAILEKEKAQLTKKNECLLEDIKTYGKALAAKEENK